MDRRAAKDLLHIQGWIQRVDEIVQRGKNAYLADILLQEAGDSPMMKLGEAANRLSRAGVLAPEGIDWALAVANRNFIIHQYDAINRAITWQTLSVDLPEWRDSLLQLFADADSELTDEADEADEADETLRPKDM